MKLLKGANGTARMEAAERLKDLLSVLQRKTQELLRNLQVFVVTSLFQTFFNIRIASSIVLFTKLVIVVAISFSQKKVSFM